MGIARIVNTDFWSDDKVVYFTPKEKYLMVYLLTNPHCKQLGIYELNPRIVAFETGVTEAEVEDTLNKLEKKHGVIIRQDNEIAIKNFLRYAVIRGGKPVMDCLRSDIKAVKHQELVEIVVKHVLGYNNISLTVREVLEEYVKSCSGTTVNVNGGIDNVKVDDEITETKETFKYAESVKMTREEYARLIEKVGSEDGAKRCIEILNNYKIGYGRKYKNDYRAILSWVVSKYEEEQSKKSSNRNRRTQGMSAAEIAAEAERIMNGGGGSDNSANIGSLPQGMA